MASSYDQRHIIRSPHEPLSQAEGPQRGDNLAAFLERNPNKVPDDKAAYIRLDGKVLTRRDLFKASRATAWSIQNVLKLDVGARIAIFSPNSTWYPVVVHANLSAGVTNVTLSPAYSAEELSHPLADCRPDYIFAAPALVDVARDAMKRVRWYWRQTTTRHMLTTFLSSHPARPSCQQPTPSLDVVRYGS